MPDSPKPRKPQARTTRFDREMRKKFLRLIAENGANISSACRDLAIPRDRFYKYRKTHPKFAAAWDRAAELGIDKLEDEAKRRALEGVEEPIYYKGQLCGQNRRPSDALLAFLLKGHRDKYKEKHELSGPGGQPLAPGVVVYLPDNGRDPDPNAAVAPPELAEVAPKDAEDNK